MEYEEQKVKIYIPLVLTSDEFQLIFKDGEITAKYYDSLKKLVLEKFKCPVTVNKKKLNPNTLTFQLKCGHLMSENSKQRCEMIASVSVKLHKIHGDTVEMEFISSCTHFLGSYHFLIYKY